MRLKLGDLLLAGVLGAGVLAGCGKNPAAPSNVQAPPSEQFSVTTTLDSVPSFTTDDVYNSSSVISLTRVSPRTAPAGVQAAISPIHFWRTFWSAGGAFQFAYSDPDTAGRPLLTEVTIDRELRGDFHILPGMPADTTQPDTTHVVDKPFTEGWQRKLLFHRVASDTLGLEWRLVAASGVKVSLPGNPARIVSVQLQAMSGADTVYTDPTVLLALPRIPRYTPGDSVTVTVTTLRNDNVAVLYTIDGRMLMHNNGDNTYSYRFGVGDFTDWRHLAVNVVTHLTLYDDLVPYDSETWILPYTITTDPMVSYLP